MNETIVALASAPGESGIAVIRVSGNDAVELVSKYYVGKGLLSEAKTHTIHYGKFIFNNILIDTVTIAIFLSPNSYTGEDVIEISSHGNMLIVGKIIDALISDTIRAAEPGEFTRRAFLNGKMNLMQVEAVADIIHTKSEIGAQTAARQLAGNFNNRLNKFNEKLLNTVSLLELGLDFADEDIEFVDKNQIKNLIEEIIKFCSELIDSYMSAKILRSGYFIGIVGYPNSGKSTLFNNLLRKQRSIVSNIPGTTRDYIEDTIYFADIPVKIIDTAGIRDSKDTIEIEGIKLAESVLEEVNMILIINDASVSFHNSTQLYNNIQSKYSNTDVLLLHNKIDLLKDVDINQIENEHYISAKFSNGINDLKREIAGVIKFDTKRIKDVLINQRHESLLKTISIYLHRALMANQSDAGSEIIAIDLRLAANTFAEITGEKWNDDVINNIFSNFCIGK